MEVNDAPVDGKDDMSILNDTFCVYCQRYFERPGQLQKHILKSHPNTYASAAVLSARAALERSRLPEMVDSRWPKNEQGVPKCNNCGALVYDPNRCSSCGQRT